MKVDSHQGRQNSSMQQVFQIFWMHVMMEVRLDEDLSHNLFIRVADNDVEGLVIPVVEEVDQVAEGVFVHMAVGRGQGVNFDQQEVVNETRLEIARMRMMGMMVMMMLFMRVMELMRHHIEEFLTNSLTAFRWSRSVRIRRQRDGLCF